MDSVARSTRFLAVVAALAAVAAAAFCAQRTASALPTFAQLGVVLPALTVAMLDLGAAWRSVSGWIVTLAALAVGLLPAFMLAADGRRARRAYALALTCAVSAVLVVEGSLALPLWELQMALSPDGAPPPPSDWLGLAAAGASLYLLVVGLFLAGQWVRLIWREARVPADERARVEVARAIVVASASAATLGAITAAALPSSFDPGPLAPLLRPDLAAGSTVSLVVVLGVVFIRARRTEAPRTEP